MTYNIFLQEDNAQSVVNELANGTKIVTEPDSDGWVKLQVVIDYNVDVLKLYHAGMAVARQVDAEYYKNKVA